MLAGPRPQRRKPPLTRSGGGDLNSRPLRPERVCARTCRSDVMRAPLGARSSRYHESCVGRMSAVRGIATGTLAGNRVTECEPTSPRRCGRRVWRCIGYRPVLPSSSHVVGFVAAPGGDSDHRSPRLIDRFSASARASIVQPVERDAVNPARALGGRGADVRRDVPRDPFGVASAAAGAQVGDRSSM